MIKKMLSESHQYSVKCSVIKLKRATSTVIAVQQKKILIAII